jgi:phenylalanyl-tRNA synthetase beta chain
VAAALVRVGLEEEGIHRVDITGPVVVGEVLSAEHEPQSNGKTILWCQVRVGAGDGPDDVRGIVCGAHNFGAGDSVVVALPGSTLPGGYDISARRTYGHTSDGMICSPRELGIGDDHAGILVLSTLGLSAQPGTDAVKLLGLDDVTVEVNVTPDRGYCLSLRGIAREYALSTGGEFRDPAGADVVVPVPDAEGHEVRLADNAPLRGRAGCDRYVARIVRGVDATAISPYWMQRVLQQCGMRPISLAVDVTNYVMLSTGQPMHAFDLHRLAGPIVVRRAVAGERLTTLDGVERTLHAEDLLITDEAPQSRVLAIAGVMGGASSEVSATTTDVLIESAHFDPVTVARSARRHKLSTEASKRYERGVDSALADRAAELAVRLLVEHGGGSGDTGVTDVDERLAAEPILMADDLPSRLVGVEYSAEQVEGALRAVGCDVVRDDHELVVVPPSWRPDLVEGADLVEEVRRVVGYDTIPSVLPVAPAGRGLTRSQHLRRSAARTLADLGFVEVLSYPFVAPQRHDELGLPADDPRRTALRLANPMSDELPLLRTSLLSTLVDAARRNISRGARDLALFEVGRVFRPLGRPTAAPEVRAGVRPGAGELAQLEAGVPPQPRRIAVLLTGQREAAGVVGAWPGGRLDRRCGRGPGSRGSAECRAQCRCRRACALASRTLRATELPDGTLAGHAGELHPRVVTALELPERTCAAELDLDLLVEAAPAVISAAAVSTHPVALRDVALVVDASVPAASVEAALRAGAGSLLEQVRLFDDYRGSQIEAGRRSLAYRLVLRAGDRTLTGEEADAVVEAAVAEAAADVGAVRR